MCLCVSALPPSQCVSQRTGNIPRGVCAPLHLCAYVRVCVCSCNLPMDVFHLATTCVCHPTLEITMHCGAQPAFVHVSAHGTWRNRLVHGCDGWCTACVLLGCPCLEAMPWPLACGTPPTHVWHEILARGSPYLVPAYGPLMLRWSEWAMPSTSQPDVLARLSL